MGLFSKIFNKQEEDDGIAYDAYQVKSSADTSKDEEDPTAGCNRCKNKQDGFCKGKSFRCEAFNPVDEEQTDK